MILQQIQDLRRQIPNLKEPYYENIIEKNNLKLYKLRYLPLEEEYGGNGYFVNPLGEPVGNTCINGRFFFYNPDGALIATIEWYHQWRSKND